MYCRLLASILLAVPFAFSQEATTEIEFASQYVAEGVELGDFTLHPSFEMGNETLYGGLWAAIPLENRGKWSAEYELYAGKSWATGKDLSIDAGVTRIFVDGAEDSTELYLGIAGEVKSVATTFYLYRDLDFDVWIGEATGSYGFPFFDKVMELTARCGTVQADGDVDYFYCGLDAELIFELRPNLDLSLGGHWAESDLGGPGAGSKIFGTLSLTAGW